MIRMKHPHPTRPRFHSGTGTLTACLSQLEHTQLPSLVDPALKTLSNVADIVGGSSPAVTEIVGVDAARVVLAKCRVDGLRAPLVAPVLEIFLVVLSASDDHRSDFGLKSILSVFPSSKAGEMMTGNSTYLAEASAPREAGAVRALHESSGRNTLSGAIGGPDANVAVALW